MPPPTVSRCPDATPSRAPGVAASRDSLFHPGVRDLFAPYLDERMMQYVRTVAQEADRQLRASGGTFTHGHMVRRLALALGVRRDVADKVGIVLDALQPVIELADNLADEEVDRRLGRAVDERYPGIPRATLLCLPSVMAGCAVATLHRWFPEPPFRTGYAVARMIAAFAAMVRGQGEPEGAASRLDRIAGEQGRLLCLPLWLLPEGQVPEGLDVERIEEWAFRYGRLWQLWQEVRDLPEDEEARARLREGVRAAREAWPGFGPFRPGGSFCAERLLGALPG